MPLEIRQLLLDAEIAQGRNDDGLDDVSDIVVVGEFRVVSDGVDGDCLAQASLFAAFAELVSTYGEDAVAKFVEWMADPQSNTDHTAEAFALVPADLTRTISLRHTVDMVRVAMEYFEQVVPLLARSEEQLTALTVGILRYSRDLAFAAASGYANAAEARGSWDARMEASVVDAVVRGDTGPELMSRAAALNWDTTAPATVVVGTPPPDRVELAGAGAAQHVAQGPEGLVDQHQAQGVHRIEVPVERRRGDAGLPGHLAQAQRGKTALGQQVQRGVEDGAPGGLLALIARGGRLGCADARIRPRTRLFEARRAALM